MGEIRKIGKEVWIVELFPTEVVLTTHEEEEDVKYIPMLPDFTVGENDHNRCPKCGSMDILVFVGTKKFSSCNVCHFDVSVGEWTETVMEAELEG